MLIDLITIDGKIGTRIKESYIKTHYYEYWLEINIFSKKYGFEELTWKNRIYNYMYNITKLPICPNCGGHVNFRGRKDQLYSTYCSSKCCGEYNIDNSAIVRQKTVNEKYGCDNVFQSNSVKEKIIKTNLENYGYENPNKCKEVREKIIKTNLERYNTEYYTQTEECKEKFKKTCQEKYGTDSPLQNENIKNKIKQTFINKYGSDHPMHVQEIKDKLKSTNIVRYGTDNPRKNKQIIEKVKLGIIEFHKNDEEKIIRCKENWGIDIIYIGNRRYEYTCPNCNETMDLDYHFIYNRAKSNHDICIKCNPMYNSMSEDELTSFVNEIGKPLLIK